MTPGNDHRSSKEVDSGQIVGLPLSESDSFIWRIRPSSLAVDAGGILAEILLCEQPIMLVSITSVLFGSSRDSYNSV